MEIRTRQVVEWRVEALWDHGFEFAADQGLAIMISHAPDPAAAAPTAAGCSGAGFFTGSNSRFKRRNRFSKSS